MADIKGTYNEQFRGVRDALAKNLDSGQDIGASAAVFIDGKPLVDIWGGYVDKAKTREWQRDTIVNNFSTTKTMTALCTLILADRDEIDLNERVAKYWREFAQNGKDKLLVRHLLGHTSGLPGWTEPVTIEDILDREKAARLLAEQAPWWEPGTDTGYQSITHGPLLGEVIRRVTGKTLGEFFATEVAEPLGADYHIGTGPECDSRVSPMIQSSPIRSRSGDDTVMDRVFFNPYVTPQIASTVEWRRGELGGSNGHGNARSVAQVQSIIACGGEVNGIRFLSEPGVRRTLEVQSERLDQVLGFPVRWGLGFALNGDLLTPIYGDLVKGRTLAYWGGSGGSIVVNDLDARMTVAFVMNKHVESDFTDERGISVIRAAYDALLGEQSVATGK